MLIDREALLAKCHTQYDWNDVVDVEDIKSAPVVDAVEIVRCGECENWYRNNNDEYAKKYSCQIRNSYTASTDYCSFGKRRESEGT